LIHKHIPLVFVALVSIVLNSACATSPSTATPIARFVFPTKWTSPPSRTPGPTITASGPLLGAPPRKIATRFFARVPQMLGRFPVTFYEQDYSDPIHFAFTNSDGAVYHVEMYFYGSPQSAYLGYHGIVPTMPGGQAVPLGDEAFVSAQATRWLAVMRYRDTLTYVEVLSSYMTVDEPPIRTPLTNDELIAVIKDIYEKILHQ
jgi:hypothetical protein